MTISSLRSNFREQRAAAAGRRALERELRSYSTPAEIDDLLAAVDRSDDPEAEFMRAILTDNLITHHRLASAG